MGHQVTAEGERVASAELDYSLQSLPQNERGQLSSRSQRPVRTYQSASQGVSGAKAKPVISVDYEEKGADRRLSQQGKGVAACGRAPSRCAYCDFIDPKLGKGYIPYGASMTWRATKALGQRRHRPRLPPNSPSSPFRRWWYRMGRPRVPRGHRTPPHVAERRAEVRCRDLWTETRATEGVRGRFGTCG